MARSRQTVAHDRSQVSDSHPLGERLSDEWLTAGRFTVEQRGDGAVVVRVHSAGRGREQLPDAVFAFRCGDPQFSYWLSRLEETKRAGAD